jgi:hypothetical protein
MAENKVQVKGAGAASKTKVNKRIGRWQTKIYKSLSVLGDINAVAQSQRINKMRKVGYPIARATNTAKAGFTGRFKGAAGLSARGASLATGYITGKAVQSVVPQFLGPVLGRFARKEVAGALNNTKFIRGLHNKTRTVISSIISTNGPQVNSRLQRMTIGQKSQYLLSMMENTMRAYAPDVSSGQYLIGFNEATNAKYRAEELKEDVMMRTTGENWFVDGGGYRMKNSPRRDIFGFSKPGQARAFLLKSIEQTPIHPSKTRDALLYGAIAVGGSPHFPWIHAVEYGGKLPYYTRSNWNAKKGRRDYQQGKDKLNEKYIQPSFFINRAVETSIKIFKDAASMSVKKDATASTRRYSKWKALAKKRGGIDKIAKSEQSFMPASKKASAITQQYRLDKAARGSVMLSRMESKIPGVVVNNAHGNFYSPELAKAIGVKLVPEEINFTITVPNSANYSRKQLKELSSEYIKGGGDRSAVQPKFDEILTSGTNEGPMGRTIANYTTGGDDRFDGGNLSVSSQTYHAFSSASKFSTNISDRKRFNQILENVYTIRTRKAGDNTVVSLTKKRSDAGKSRAPRKSYSSGGNKANRNMYKLAQELVSGIDVNEIDDLLS